MSRLAFAALLFLLAAGAAAANPVKCVDASGKIRYLDESMVGEAKCKPVRDAMNIVAPQKEPKATTEPNEGGLRRQRARENPRPETDTRLADAEAKLADAKSKLAEQEAVRLGGERNFSRVQERLQPFQEAVQRAQQQVDEIRRESR
jgi:hypothetical protein